MFWRYYCIITLIVGVLGITSSHALPPEAEEFSFYEDPQCSHKVYMHIIDRYPTVEEMETAKAEYERGLPLLKGELRTTFWGKSKRVGQDIPTGLKLLRHAAYVGHPHAIDHLSMALDGYWGVLKHEILAKALSNSSITAKKYWEQAQDCVEDSRPIPTVKLIHTDPHKAWQRYCEQRERETHSRRKSRSCVEDSKQILYQRDISTVVGSSWREEAVPLLATREGILARRHSVASH